MCKGSSTPKKDAFAMAGYRKLPNTPAPFPLSEPPFSVKDLRQVIPKHCFERSALTSFWHLFVNVCICAVLMVIAWAVNDSTLPWLCWPIYWFVQGSYMTGIWVIAHECGHQAFSASKALNDAVGLVLHAMLLVPYHSWRISHRRHHSNTNSCENDEVFVPASRSAIEPYWNELWEESPIYNVFKIFIMLTVGWIPGYLVFNSTGPAKYNGKNANHFSPNAAIFSTKEKMDIVVSDVAFFTWVGCLIALQYLEIVSFVNMTKYYFIPYLVVNAFLVLITFLQHTDTYVPHFREGEWTWLRGALCTVDRSFGTWLNHVLHHITDTHVCHHLFSTMPFYHAEEATEAIKPILKEYYLSDDTSIPVATWRAYTNCKYVEDDKKIVFYQKSLLKEKPKSKDE